MKAFRHFSIFLVLLSCTTLMSGDRYLNHNDEITGKWLEPTGCANVLTLGSKESNYSDDQYSLASTKGCVGGNEQGTYSSTSSSLTFKGVNFSLPPQYQAKNYTCSYRLSHNKLTLKCEDGSVRTYKRI